MHHVVEILLPQVDNVEEAIAEIMVPFDENVDEPEERTGQEFWDFYVIGGRWAGHKLTAALDQDKLTEFYEALTEKKVTVSGITCGKEEIKPTSQIPMVDKLWSEFFPEYNGRACPLFNHANNQYVNDCLYGDVMRLKDVTPDLKCTRFIVANYDYQGEKLEAKGMLSTSVWNGVNFEDTAWDGTLGKAIELYNEKMKNYNEEYRANNTPDGDWILVTVDCHN